jgi:sugar phosphate isomerase/epimerase
VRVGAFTLSHMLGGVAVEATLEGIADAGFRLVNYVTVQAADMRRLGEDDLRRIARTFRASGLEPCQFCAILPTNPASVDGDQVRSHMDLWRRAVRFAAELGFRNVLTFPGEYEPGVLRATTWTRAAEQLRLKCREAEGLNLILSLESSPRVFQLCNTTEALGELIRAVGVANLTATVDTGHMCIQREAPDELRHIREILVHLHLSDNAGREDTNDALGTGMCDIAGYVREAVRLDFQANAAKWGLPPAACIEIGDPARYSATGPAVLLARSREHLENTLGAIAM